MILQINEFHVDICEGAECLIYTEKSLKTFKDGMKQRKSEPKIKYYFNK